MAGELILLRRGPLTFLQQSLGPLPEGEPYEAGIVVADGSVFELLYLGGHDGQNKLLGGGFQTTDGEPAFTAPAGAAAYDMLNQLLWISNGASWTAFCPCLTNSSNPPPIVSSSGSAAGGGGGDKVILPNLCSGAPLATTYHLTVSGPCTALNGTYALNWDSNALRWYSSTFNYAGINDGQFYMDNKGTTDPTRYLVVVFTSFGSVSGSGQALVNCPPAFTLTGTLPITGGLPCGSKTINWTVS